MKPPRIELPRSPEANINRRHWMKNVAAASAIVSARGITSAIEPIARQSGPRFSFSVAGYSYHSLLNGAKATLTLDEFIRDCAAMQAEAVELTSYYFPEEITPTYINHLKQLCFQLGLDISGTAIRNEFCLPPGEAREAELRHVRTWVDHAAAMGAPVIRIFSGSAEKGQSAEEAQRLAVEAIEASCQYAGEHGVTLALENHGGLTATADELLSLVKAVQSPWFGVNLDTGNFHSRDIYGDLARLAPYAVNVQIKVMVHAEGEPKQPADMRRIAAILRDAGYRGYVVLEYEESEDPRQAVPRWFASMREAFTAS